MSVESDFLEYVEGRNELLDVDDEFSDYLENYFAILFQDIKLPTPFNNYFGTGSCAAAAQQADKGWYNENKSAFLDNKLRNEEWKALTHPEENIVKTEGLQDVWEEFLYDYVTDHDVGPDGPDKEFLDELETYVKKMNLEFDPEEHLKNEDDE